MNSNYTNSPEEESTRGRPVRDPLAGQQATFVNRSVNKTLRAGLRRGRSMMTPSGDGPGHGQRGSGQRPGPKRAANLDPDGRGGGVHLPGSAKAVFHDVEHLSCKP